MSNIVQLLDKRKISHWDWSIESLVVNSIKKRKVTLADILNKELLQGHVVLGFSQKGDCIISYRCTINFQKYVYWLFWWHFDINKRLSLVSKFPLFKDESIENSLYILLYEDGFSTYVLGCRNNVMESKPCYVSILPTQSPHQSCCTYAIYFKFELLLPYPCVHVCKHHSIPGYLIINTGISIICVTYELLNQCEVSQLDNIDNPSNMCTFTKFDVQHFVTTNSEVEMAGISTSCSIRAYNGDTAMLLLKKHCKVSTGLLVVKQTTLDVDSWISRILPLILRDEQYEYQCLCDYDLKLFEMDLWYSVVFILVAVVQVTSSIKLECIKYSVLIIGQWNTKSGFVQVLHVFRVPYRPSNSYSSRWLYILTNMRKFHELITLSCFTTKSLSNETVFTGNSLQEIPHPFLPINLCL